MTRVKYKYIVIVLVIGVIIYLLGTAKKIMHHPGADTLLTIAFCVVTVGIVAAMIKMLSSKK